MSGRKGSIAVLRPDWPAPASVSALVTSRSGGVSLPPRDTLNLALHVGDQPAHVEQNRHRLQQLLPGGTRLQWLNQVHGTRVFNCTDPASTDVPEADAAIARQAGQGVAVLTADCLPVLFADTGGRCVAVAHAGWRGLQAGVLENVVKQMDVPADEVLAWLGPAIGPCHFEVGEEVREAFLAEAGTDCVAVAACFQACNQGGKWMADLYGLARSRLAAAGVQSVCGGGLCTHCEVSRFYSYRRDGETGRMASLIWLNNT